MRNEPQIHHQLCHWECLATFRTTQLETRRWSIRWYFWAQYFSPILPSLRGEQSSLDKVITGWLSGEEILMNPDKACGLPVWWARLWEDDLITFHLTVINWLLELEEKCSLVMILGTSFETVVSRGERKRETASRLYCDEVQLFSSVTSQSREAVVVSEN